MKILPSSHLDHGLSLEQIAFVLEQCKGRTSFFIETFTLPEHLGTVPCGLFGPIVGDLPVLESEVVYEKRGERSYVSRLVDRAPHPSRSVTVIAGPAPGEDEIVLYTAFGGPLAPREPGDPSIASNFEEIAVSAAFWCKHALARVSEGS